MNSLGRLKHRLNQQQNKFTFGDEYEINFEISYDNITWISAGCNYLEIDLSPLSRKGDRVYVRADMDKITSISEDFSSVYLDSEVLINVGGNIKSLGNNSNSCFCLYGFFSGCFYLIDATDLIFPNTPLFQKCYYQMFSHCSSLVSPPNLPATTLADGCYKFMFYDCLALTRSPELPATTLASQCYTQMFQGCSGISLVRKISATTIDFYSCSFMFKDCTSITSVSDFSPTTMLANGCCYHMFEGCKSLTYAPSLPATTLTDYCYLGMFIDCTSLIVPPNLPATTLKKECYESMFYGCKSMLFSTESSSTYNKEYRIPTSGTATSKTGDMPCYNMFTGTRGSFTGTPATNKTYYYHP